MVVHGASIQHITTAYIYGLEEYFYDLTLSTLIKFPVPIDPPISNRTGFHQPHLS